MSESNIQPKTFFDQYNEFADACDIPKGSLIDPPNIPAIKLGERLVVEEWEVETKAALARYLENPSLENMVEVADGIGDTIYVCCQLARALGIPLNRVYNTIHAANMAKVDPQTGKVRKREDGKVLKPEGWQPPNIFDVLFLEGNREAMRRGKLGAENWPESKVEKQIGQEGDSNG